MPNTDNALIASSDFDPSAYITGLNAMTGSLDTFIAKEDELNKKLAEGQKILAATNSALSNTNGQIASLDKTSASYTSSLTKLTAQQQQLQQQHATQQAALKSQQDQLTQVTTSTENYKKSLAGITEVSKQVRATGGDIFNVAGMTAQLQQVNQVAGNFRNIFQGKIDSSALDDIEDKLAGTNDSFQQLAEAVNFVQENLDKVDPHSQDYKDLTDVVKVGTTVLGEFAKVQDRVADRSASARQRILALRNEMVNMKTAGQQDTQAFRDLQAEAGELQDNLDKVNQRIHTFSNDTRGLEAAIEAVRGIAAGFELAEGASALFGVSEENAQESIKRLNAIMAIANGLQEINNLIKKDSVLRLAAEEVATKAYAASQRILAVTLGTTAAASKGLAAALAATGVGALIVGISILVDVMSTWTGKTEEQLKAQERLNDANKLGADILQSYIGVEEELLQQREAGLQREQAANQKVRQFEVDRLKQSAHNAEQLRTLQKQALKDQLADTEAEIEKQRAGAEDADTRLEAIRAKNKAAQEELDQATNKIQQSIARSHFADTKLLDPLEKTVEEFSKLQSKAFELRNAQETQENKFQTERINERIAIRRAELAAFEDYQKRVVDLQKRLTDAQNKQARQDAGQLTKTAQDNLAAEFSSLDRDVRLKNITQVRADTLKRLAKQVAQVDLSTELREFEKKSLSAQQSIEDELLNLRLSSAATRASLLEDELEKEAAGIQAAYRQEFAKLEQDRTAALTANKETFDQGLISPLQFERNAERIKATYVQLFADLEAITAQKQEEIARKSYARGIALLQQLFAASGVQLTERTNKQIDALTRRFVTGKILYDRYQRELTAILLKESTARIRQDLAEANEELAAIQRRQAAETDPQKQKELRDQEIAQKAKIADLTRQADAAEAAGTEAKNVEFARKVGVVAKYAAAIGSVVDNVVKFWQLANEAEEKALNRSIALQEQRVAYATTIAARGNAEYLRLEEDRLTALQVKQENAARRQLAINAVLQTSQAIVAFTSALAQGIATGGPLGGIAIAAAVIGAIAAGYAIIQSLKPQVDLPTQKLKGGTKSVERNGAPPGVDTVHALLTEGETVLPVHRARAYRPAIDAIFDGTIAPGLLNDFVRDTHVGRRNLPELAYGQIGEATDIHSGYDARLVAASMAQTQQLQEANDRLADVHTALKTMGFSVNLDKKGLAISVAGALSRMNINKKL